MNFTDEGAERLYKEHFAAQRLRNDQFYGAVQVVVSLLLTFKLGIERQSRQLLWSSTLFSFLALAPSVLNPRLYIRARPYLLFAARVVLGLLMPELIYRLAVYPYKGSSLITPTRAAFFGVWFWHSRWLGQQIALAGFINVFNVEMVLLPAGMFIDMGNNTRLCREITRFGFHRGLLTQLAAAWPALADATAGSACAQWTATDSPTCTAHPPTCPAEDTLWALLQANSRAVVFCENLFLVSQVLLTLVLPLAVMLLLELRSRRAFLARNQHNPQLYGACICFNHLGVALVALGAAVCVFVDFLLYSRYPAQPC